MESRSLGGMAPHACPQFGAAHAEYPEGGSCSRLLPLPLLLKLPLSLLLNPVERAVTSVRGAGKGAASV